MAEKTIQYVESVQELAEAWEFIMAVVDEFKQPEVHITPKVIYDGDLDGESRQELIEVMVRGAVGS